MPGSALERRRAAVLWDLRTAWATNRWISVTLDLEHCPRLEGTVGHVAASSTHATIAGRHVPIARILAVHWPTRLGDSTQGHRPGHRRRRPAALEQIPGQQRLFDLTAAGVAIDAVDDYGPARESRDGRLCALRPR